MQLFPADFGKPWKVSKQGSYMIAYKATLNTTLMESSNSAVQEAATMVQVPWGEIYIHTHIYIYIARRLGNRIRTDSSHTSTYDT